MPSGGIASGALSVGGSLLSGFLGAEAEGKAADAQLEAARMAAEAQLEGTKLTLEELKRQYDQSREDFAPYREAGAYHLNVLSGVTKQPQQLVDRSGKQFSVTPEGYKINPNTGKVNANWRVDSAGNVFINGAHDAYVKDGRVTPGRQAFQSQDWLAEGAEYSSTRGKQFSVTPEGYKILPDGTIDKNWQTNEYGTVFHREGGEAATRDRDPSGQMIKVGYLDPDTGQVVMGEKPRPDPSGTWGYQQPGQVDDQTMVAHGAAGQPGQPWDPGYQYDPYQQGAYTYPTEPGAEAFTYAEEPTYEEFDFDPTMVAESPGYQFRLAEGEKGTERALAAGGRRLSGRGLKELQRFSQGLASTEYGNEWARQFGEHADRRDYESGRFGREYARRAGEYGDYRDYLSGLHGRERTRGFESYQDWRNRLAALAGVGQTSTASLSELGGKSAAAAGGALMLGAGGAAGGYLDAGTARAEGYRGKASAWTGAVEDISSNKYLQDWLAKL